MELPPIVEVPRGLSAWDGPPRSDGRGFRSPRRVNMWGHLHGEALEREPGGFLAVEETTPGWEPPGPEVLSPAPNLEPVEPVEDVGEVEEMDVWSYLALRSA